MYRLFLIMVLSCVGLNVLADGGNGSAGNVNSTGQSEISLYDADGNPVRVVVVADTVDLAGTNAIPTAAVLHAFTNSTKVAPLRADASTHALKGISYPHAELHEGNHYEYCMDGTNVGAGDGIAIIIETDDSAKWFHGLFSAYGALQSRFFIYEGVTNSNSTAVVFINNQRNSTNEFNGNAYLAANIVTNGLRLVDLAFGIDTGVGNNLRVGGGSSRGDNEIILKQNTRYLIGVGSLTAANNINFQIAGYLHTDKD